MITAIHDIEDILAEVWGNKAEQQRLRDGVKDSWYWKVPEVIEKGRYKVGEN